MQVRETDIETLERCVSAVAFGDLDAEDARNLTEVNFVRIIRLGQLTAEYLLHVQDRLAYDNCLLKVCALRSTYWPRISWHQNQELTTGSTSRAFADALSQLEFRGR